MWEEDAGVACARWEAEAGIGLIAQMRDGVAAFARRHGMIGPTRDDVRCAVAEAVADAVVRLRRSDEAGRVTVDAATDGRWLTVRVSDDAAVRTDGPHSSLPLVACLPHRLEWARDERGSQLVMEFAMASGAAVPENAARRRSGSAREPACRSLQLRLVGRRRP